MTHREMRAPGLQAGQGPAGRCLRPALRGDSGPVAGEGAPSSVCGRAVMTAGMGRATPLILGLFLAAGLALAAPAMPEMVDTVQYGHIQVGMKEKEVRQRLGPPDRVQQRERRVGGRGSSQAGGRTIRTKRLVYTGVNPASGQRITTTIILENGKVVDKKRSYD